MTETHAPYTVGEMAESVAHDQQTTLSARTGEAVGIYFGKLREAGIEYRDAVKMTRDFQDAFLLNALNHADAVLHIDASGLMGDLA